MSFSDEVKVLIKNLHQFKEYCSRPIQEEFSGKLEKETKMGT